MRLLSISPVRSPAPHLFAIDRIRSEFVILGAPRKKVSHALCMSVEFRFNHPLLVMSKHLVTYHRNESNKIQTSGIHMTRINATTLIEGGRGGGGGEEGVGGSGGGRNNVVNSVCPSAS